MVTKLVKKLPELIQSRWAKNGRVKFVITAVGVFSTYLIIGILQEKIMKTPYGANNDDTIGETFKYANTLVDVYLIFGLIFMKSKSSSKYSIEMTKANNKELPNSLKVVKIVTLGKAAIHDEQLNQRLSLYSEIANYIKMRAIF